MHGHVDPPCQQRLLDLLDEDTARADLAERLRPVAVARGRDRHQRDLDSRAPQQLARLLCLRQREPRAARADPDERQTETSSRSGSRSTRRRASSASSPTSRSSRASLAAMITTHTSSATNSTREAAATYFSDALEPVA